MYFSVARNAITRIYEFAAQCFENVFIFNYDSLRDSIVRYVINIIHCQRVAWRC